MKVIFCTNLPSPYRVDFFNELGKYVDLTVLYERKSSSERNDAWKGISAESFKEVYLDLKLVGVDQSKGSALRRYIAKHKCDVLIMTGYSSLATMEAIVYCRLINKPYFIEYDGGLNKKNSFLQGIIKKFFLRGAKSHLTTCEEHIQYLKSIGIRADKIHKYPFTSVKEKDIIDLNTVSPLYKQQLRLKLGMTEQKVLLSVGRFSYEAGYGKGYDLLLKVAKQCGPNFGFYIVGDNPTEEFLCLKKELNLQNVHYVGFKSKKDLVEYYMAADLFILLSRGDVWGLVVNEAMAVGLPVISSDRCIAGMELVVNDESGYVVSLDDVSNISGKVVNVFSDERKLNQMRDKSLEIIRGYTIEKMAERHIQILDKIDR